MYFEYPRDSKISLAVGMALYSSKMNASLRSIHAEMPEIYWRAWIREYKKIAAEHYVWRNDIWVPVVKPELPTFEIIKHGLEL
jgi:hypothetical protein